MPPVGSPRRGRWTLSPSSGKGIPAWIVLLLQVLLRVLCGVCVRNYSDSDLKPSQTLLKYRHTHPSELRFFETCNNEAGIQEGLLSLPGVNTPWKKTSHLLQPSLNNVRGCRADQPQGVYAALTCRRPANYLQYGKIFPRSLPILRRVMEVFSVPYHETSSRKRRQFSIDRCIFGVSLMTALSVSYIIFQATTSVWPVSSVARNKLMHALNGNPKPSSSSSARPSSSSASSSSSSSSTSSSPAAETFASMGSARAASTETGYTQARGMFNDFLRRLNLKRLPLNKTEARNAEKSSADDLVSCVSMQEVCKVDILQQYATFLFEAKHGKDDDYYKYETALQYISGAKTLLEQLWGGKCIEKNDPEGVELASNKKKGRGPGDWYSILRRNTEDAFMARCISQGLLGKEKADPVYERDLLVICSWLLKSATTKGMAQRCYLILVYHCCGRAGELSKTVYSHLLYDNYFGCVTLDWTQAKTARMKCVNVFPHISSFIICPLHALFCYFVCSGATSRLVDFVFDELATVSASTNKVNSVFANFFKECLEAQTVQEGLTSRGLRVGSANVIADLVSLAAAINRGGWNMEGVTTLFEYLLQVMSTDRRAGRVLSGWSPDAGGKAILLEDLDVLNSRSQLFNESFSGSMNNMLVDLFGNHMHLQQPVMSALTASFFVHARAFHEAYGDIQPFARVKAICDQYNINFWRLSDQLAAKHREINEKALSLEFLRGSGDTRSVTIVEMLEKILGALAEASARQQRHHQENMAQFQLLRAALRLRDDEQPLFQPFGNVPATNPLDLSRPQSSLPNSSSALPPSNSCHPSATSSFSSRNFSPNTSMSDSTLRFGGSFHFSSASPSFSAFDSQASSPCSSHIPSTSSSSLSSSPRDLPLSPSSPSSLSLFLTPTRSSNISTSVSSSSSYLTSTSSSHFASHPRLTTSSSGRSFSSSPTSLASSAFGMVTTSSPPVPPASDSQATSSSSSHFPSSSCSTSSPPDLSRPLLSTVGSSSNLFSAHTRNSNISSGVSSSSSPLASASSVPSSRPPQRRFVETPDFAKASTQTVKEVVETLINHGITEIVSLDSVSVTFGGISVSESLRYNTKSHVKRLMSRLTREEKEKIRQLHESFPGKQDSTYQDWKKEVSKFGMTVEVRVMAIASAAKAEEDRKNDEERLAISYSARKKK
eukprot:gb/GEZN01000679.1/.p1 GENE.gb/GEZN01000679.1/~~gb/GEZN01000679.1/.p1  ORF type:complete len:1182 (-),score=133.34 gb/GEZN01000679.1/:312-3833(-)